MHSILTTSGLLATRVHLNSEIECEMRGVIYRLLSEENNSNGSCDGGSV